MTLMEQIRGQMRRDAGGNGGESEQSSQPGRVNVSEGERAVSVAAGSIMAMLGLRHRSIPGMLVAALGGGLIYRGATGHCAMYEALDMNTARDSSAEEEIGRNGIQVAQSFLINRSPEDLYNYWRNFENLPRIMTHLESVRVSDDRRSHWVAKAPRLAGGSVEWDAEITRDEKNELIAWRSLPGSQIDTTGEIRFAPYLGGKTDRGTEVHVLMHYVPPGGRMGHWLTSMLGENPKRVVREDLRNFKRIMEVGEIPTIIGQPHGTCTGQGETYTESDWRPLFR